MFIICLSFCGLIVTTLKTYEKVRLWRKKPKAAILDKQKDNMGRNTKKAPRITKDRQLAARAFHVLWAALNPPAAIVACAPLGICALMAWVFLLGGEGHALSYAAYAVSAYLLIILCVWVARHFSRDFLQRLASKNAVIGKIIENTSYRRQLLVSGGLVVDTLWAIANVVIGIWLFSIWPITLGVYYLLLCLMRGPLLHHLRRPEGSDSHSAAKIERLCGVLFLLSVLTLSGIVCLVMLGEGEFVYPGVLIYAVAAFTFYSLIIAIVNYARLRRHDDILVVLNCRINLAIALVSIFALEVAMFAEFSTGGDTELQFIMSIITGAVIAIVLVAMGIRSIINANKTLKEY